MLDVDKACLRQVLPSKDGSVGVGAEFRKRLKHELGEPLQRPVVRDCVVVRMDISVYVLYLDPATRLDIAKFGPMSVIVLINFLLTILNKTSELTRMLA